MAYFYLISWELLSPFSNGKDTDLGEFSDFLKSHNQVLSGHLLNAHPSIEKMASFLLALQKEFVVTLREFENGKKSHVDGSWTNTLQLPLC